MENFPLPAIVRPAEAGITIESVDAIEFSQVHGIYEYRSFGGPIHPPTRASERLAARVAQARIGRAGSVEHIVGSYKTISIDGGFKVNNLMGERATAAPMRLVNAVIDREALRRPAGVRASDDVVEVD